MSKRDEATAVASAPIPAPSKVAETEQDAPRSTNTERADSATTTATGVPSVEQFLANPGAYGFRKVSGGKLYKGTAPNQTLLTDRFEYFLPLEDSTNAHTAIVRTLGKSWLIGVLSASQSPVVAQQNASRAKLNATPRKVSPNDAAGMARLSAETLLGVSGASVRTVTIEKEKKVYPFGGTDYATPTEAAQAALAAGIPREYVAQMFPQAEGFAK